MSGYKKGVGAVLILFLLGGGWGLEGKTGRASAAVFHSYSKPVSPPDFTVEDLDGKKFNFKNPSGEVILLNFWATWCASCRQEAPLFEKLFSRYAAQGLKIYRVNSKESPETVRKYLEKGGLSLPVLLDRTGKMGKLFGLWVHPTTYVINRKGMIVYRAIGQADWMSYEATSAIEVLLGEK
jgi:thiol-disulfide isomerase/thioredoxin